MFFTLLIESILHYHLSSYFICITQNSGPTTFQGENGHNSAISWPILDLFGTNEHQRIPFCPKCFSVEFSNFLWRKWLKSISWTSWRLKNLNPKPYSIWDLRGKLCIGYLVNFFGHILWHFFKEKLNFLTQEKLHYHQNLLIIFWWSHILKQSF